MTPQQLQQTAQFIRERYSPPEPMMTPGKYVSHEAMHALADALERTATALHVDEPRAGAAPAAVHEAIDRAWSSIVEDGDRLAIDSDGDEDVLEQLRTLSDDELNRTSFVQAIVRALTQAVRADRRAGQ